jgi:hypothetical protein
VSDDPVITEQSNQVIAFGPNFLQGKDVDSPLSEPRLHSLAKSSPNAIDVDAR